MAKKTVKNEFDFEASLQELEGIVKAMEQGGLSLEESLQKFEKGVALTRQCQNALKATEQKVQILLQQNGKEELQSFDTDNIE
jgi:exodeoxyribonuclease VII small subunit